LPCFPTIPAWGFALLKSFCQCRAIPCKKSERR
jgi:hypothetical protein